LIVYSPPSRQLTIGIRVKLFINELNRLERRGLESKKLKRETPPPTNVRGSVEVPPPKGDGNGSEPSTPIGSKADRLASELKVLKFEQKIVKLKKKLKTKNLKGQEVSSSSSNE
jgi:hypothetical protein